MFHLKYTDGGIIITAFLYLNGIGANGFSDGLNG